MVVYNTAGPIYTN